MSLITNFMGLWVSIPGVFISTVLCFFIPQLFGLRASNKVSNRKVPLWQKYLMVPIVLVILFLITQTTQTYATVVISSYLIGALPVAVLRRFK